MRARGRGGAGARSRSRGRSRESVEVVVGDLLRALEFLLFAFAAFLRRRSSGQAQRESDTAQKPIPTGF